MQEKQIGDAAVIAGETNLRCRVPRVRAPKFNLRGQTSFDRLRLQGIPSIPTIFHIRRPFSTPPPRDRSARPTSPIRPRMASPVPHPPNFHPSSRPQCAQVFGARRLPQRAVALREQLPAGLLVRSDGPLGCLRVGPKRKAGRSVEHAGGVSLRACSSRGGLERRSDFELWGNRCFAPHSREGCG